MSCVDPSILSIAIGGGGAALLLGLPKLLGLVKKKGPTPNTAEQARREAVRGAAVNDMTRASTASAKLGAETREKLHGIEAQSDEEALKWLADKEKASKK